MSRLAPRHAALVVVGLAFFADTVVYAMLPPLLPEYARIHGLSQTQLGLLFASYAAALLLAALPLGTWADRHGRRGPFLGGLLGFGAATVLFAFAGSFPMLLLARVLQGIAAAATWVAGLSMLADHFPAGQRGKAMSTVFACANLGLLLGPTFAGWMVKLWNIRAAFLFAAGLAVLDALVRLVLLPKDPPTEPSGTGYLALLKDGTIRIFAGAMVLGAALGAVLEAVLPLHLSRHLGMDAVAIGMAFTAAAVASTITSPLVGHWTDRKGAAPPLRMGMVLAGLLLALAPFVPSRMAMYGYMLAIGGTCSLLMSPCGPALAGHVERQGRKDFGSVFSLLNIAFSLGMMAGPLLGSALTDLVGMKVALVVLSCAFFLYLIPLAAPDAEKKNTLL
jgi:multidrug resistance protein